MYLIHSREYIACEYFTVKCFFFEYNLRTNGVLNEGNGQQHLYVEWLYSIEDLYSNRIYNIMRLDKFCHQQERERWIVLMDRWSSSADVCTRLMQPSSILISSIGVDFSIILYLYLNLSHCMSLVCIEFLVWWESSICQYVIIIIHAYTVNLNSDVYVWLSIGNNGDGIYNRIILDDTHRKRRDSFNAELFVVCLHILPIGCYLSSFHLNQLFIW